MTPISSSLTRQCIVCTPGIELWRYSGLLDTFVPHAHPYYVVGLVQSGMRAMSCGSNRYRLQPGDLVVLNPHDAHGCNPMEAAPFSYEGLCLHASTVEEALGYTPRFGGPVLRDTKLAHAFSAMSVRAHGNRSQGHEELIAPLARFLALLPQTQPVPPQPADDLDRIARALARTPGAPRTLGTLASQLGLSRFGTSRAFSARFGLSPNAFMQSVRVEHARRLLAEGTPPATVAQLLDYSDQAHLTRIFKQRMGLTPGSYRQAHLGCSPIGSARKELA